MPHKDSLRKEFNKIRKNHASVIAQDSFLIQQHIVHTMHFRQAKHIGFYMPKFPEMNCLPLLKMTHNLKKICYLPKIKNTLLTWHTTHSLKKNMFDVYEPRGKIMPSWLLNIIFVPLVAYDALGSRLGMGGGYYDRTLLNSRAYIIGIAHSSQEAQMIPCDTWDMKLHAILTEKGLRKF